MCMIDSFRLKNLIKMEHFKTLKNFNLPLLCAGMYIGM
jgi:hypothetical protein